ncbi:strawberry notch C-terminal domain-containing protein [Sphingomonas sanxanigenens]|uniref:strawberry notch C-terminal domain-containing protein n=1 Tax=Sphingomonas sanxanigenens TaxID=397260 RepID=UPI0009FC3A20
MSKTPFKQLLKRLHVAHLESEYAVAALHNWYQLLVAGKLTSTNLDDFQYRSGLELLDKDGVLKEDLPPIQRWLNRLLALPIALQNAIFDEFLSLVETRVDAAREAGTLDVGVETMIVEEATIIDDVILRTDPLTGATSHLLHIEIGIRRKPVSADRILRLADTIEGATTMFNTQSHMVALRMPARSLMEESDGTLIPRFEMMRPTRSDYHRAIAMQESAWEPIGRDDFITLWRAEADEAANTLHREHIRIATGLLLPIWSALKGSSSVKRVAAADGRSWLGRIVHDGDVQALYSALGLGTFTLPPAEIACAVIGGRSIDVERPFRMTFRRALVNRSQRIEILNCPADQLAWLKSLGAFTEIIGFRTRVFVPVDQAEAILTRILA